MLRTVAGLGLVFLALLVGPVAAQEEPISVSLPAWRLLLQTDFEGDVADWTLSGLWSVDGTPESMPGGAAYSGTRSLNYNNGVNYNTGGRTSGTAISPLFNIGAFGRQTITFRCNYRTQTTGTSYDKRIVRVRRDGDVVFETTLRGWGTNPPGGRCSATGTWHTHTIEIAPIANPGDIIIMIAHSMQLEFVFDSVNGQYNNYPGWFVDDVNATELVLRPTADDHGNTMETATEIAMGGPAVDVRPLDGRIERAGDVDFFKFRVPVSLLMIYPAPTITFEVRTLDLTDGMDSVIHLYDANGNELASNDDGGGGLASLIRRTVVMDGRTYYVKVRHFSSTGTGSYKINVMQVTPPPPPADDHGNTPETATAVLLGTVAGSIEPAGDVDFFSFPGMVFIPERPRPTLVIETLDLSDGMDTVLEVYGPDGTTLLAENDDAPGLGLASRVEFQLYSGTPFYVKVRHYSGSGTGSYKLRLATIGG